MLWCSGPCAWAFWCIVLVSLLPNAHAAQACSGSMFGPMDVPASTTCEIDASSNSLHYSTVVIRAGATVTIRGGSNIDFICDTDFIVQGSANIFTDTAFLKLKAQNLDVQGGFTAPLGVDVQATNMITIAGAMFNSGSGGIGLYAPSSINMDGTLNSAGIVLLNSSQIINIRGQITADTVKVENYGGSVSFHMVDGSSITAPTVTIKGDSGPTIFGSITATTLDFVTTVCLIQILGEINVAGTLTITNLGDLAYGQLYLLGPKPFYAAQLVLNNNSPSGKTFTVQVDGPSILDTRTSLTLNGHAFYVLVKGILHVSEVHATVDTSVTFNVTQLQIDGWFSVEANYLTVYAPLKVTVDRALFQIAGLITLEPASISAASSLSASVGTPFIWKGAWDAPAMTITFNGGVYLHPDLQVSGGDVSVNVPIEALILSGSDTTWQCDSVTFTVGGVITVDPTTSINVASVKVVSGSNITFDGTWGSPSLSMKAAGTADLHGTVNVGSLVVLAAGIRRYDNFNAVGSALYNSTGAIIFDAATITSADSLTILAASTIAGVQGGGIFQCQTLRITTPGPVSLTAVSTLLSVGGAAVITASSVVIPGIVGASTAQIKSTSGNVGLTSVTTAGIITITVAQQFNAVGNITGASLTVTAQSADLSNCFVSVSIIVELIVINSCYTGYIDADMVNMNGGPVVMYNHDGLRIKTLVVNVNDFLLSGTVVARIDNITALVQQDVTLTYTTVANSVDIRANFITFGTAASLNAASIKLQADEIDLPPGTTLTADRRSEICCTSGAGSANGNYISGAGHGGSGGMIANGGTGFAYGSFVNPTEPGSQAGFTLPAIGDYGGGVISITATTLFTAGGLISAIGGTSISDKAAGASGGSILVDAATLTGNGKFVANGGNGSMSGSSTGGGGGGRIALKCQTWTFGGTYEAYGGRSINNAYNGGAGTIYKKIGLESELIVDNGLTSVPSQTYNLLDGVAKRGATFLLDKPGLPTSINQVFLQGGADLVIDTQMPAQISIGYLTGDLLGSLHVFPCSSLVMNSFSCSVDPPTSEGYTTMCSSFFSYSNSFAELQDYLAVSSFLNINGTVCGVTSPHIVEVGGAYSAGSGAVFLNNCGQYQMPVTCGGTATTTTTTSAASSTTSAAATTTSTTGGMGTTTGIISTTTTTTTTGGPIIFASPTNITTNSTRRATLIKWKPIARNEIVYYTAEMDIAGNWTLQYNGTAATANVSNLNPNTTYNFRLRAFSPSGSSNYSYFSDTTKLLEKPSLSPAPSHVKYNRTAMTVQVFYPYDDGGLPILNYTLQMQNGTSWQNYTITPPSYSIEFTNLKIATAYFFKSSSRNQLGESPVSSIGGITTAPVLCGDAICDSTEDCRSCFLDCGSCGSTCVANCSYHGSCHEGICSCTSGWFGPLCDLPEPPPVVVVINNTAPVVNVGLNGTGIDFRILFDSIKEIKSDGSSLTPYPLNLTNFKFISQNVTYNNTGVTYKYSNMLSNKALVTVFISTFKNATSIVFANKTIHIPENGIKFAMNISSWPFSAVTNKLQITIRSDARAPPDVCKSTQFNYDDSNNLKWIEQSYNGHILYGTLEDSAILDKQNRTVQFGYESEFITITVPHFWDFAEFDPDFQVLVDPSRSSADCASDSSSKNISGKIAGGVVGAVVGAALAAGLVLFVIKKRKENKRRALLSSTSSTEMKTSYSGEADVKL